MNGFFGFDGSTGLASTPKMALIIKDASHEFFAKAANEHDQISDPSRVISHVHSLVAALEESRDRYAAAAAIMADRLDVQPVEANAAGS